MSKLHDLWNNTIRPKRGVVPSNPSPPPIPKKQIPKTKNQKPNYKYVEFTELSVDGGGDRLAGIVIDTIHVPKYKKTPMVYVVLVCKVNGQFKYAQSYVKYINACYCISHPKINMSKLPPNKLMLIGNKKGA